MPSGTHTHTHIYICVAKITISVSDNGLSPGRRQAILWNNAGILLIGLSGTNFSETLVGIQTFHSRKRTWKCCLQKWRIFCLGLNELWGLFYAAPCSIIHGVHAVYYAHICLFIQYIWIIVKRGQMDTQIDQKSYEDIHAYMRQWAGSSFVQVMACRVPS